MSETTQKLKYIQLADHLRELIKTGELKVGDRLPSYVELYRRFGATTATVQRVCNLLEKEQLIERRSGSGIYVTQPRRKLTGNIGLIASAAYQTPKTPFHTHLMGAIAQAAAASHQHLLYLGTEHLWDEGACHKVDSILIIGKEDPSSILQKLPPDFPVVSLIAMPENVSSVGIDEYQAGRLAARHLLEHGHRRIACLMERLPIECRRRFAGITDTLFEAGIDVEPNWTRLTGKAYDFRLTGHEDFPYRKWACEQMSDWLQNGWEETDCTALIVQNEAAAIGAIQTMQAAGIRIPEQVSVMTFDGTELCNLILPHISAVALPLEQIGATAVEVLNQKISGANHEVRAIMLPLRLRIGESVIPVEEQAEKILVECG